jgi:hypothetical protein
MFDHLSLEEREQISVDLLLMGGRYPRAFTTSSVDRTACARNAKLMSAAV